VTPAGARTSRLSSWARRVRIAVGIVALGGVPALAGAQEPSGGAKPPPKLIELTAAKGNPKGAGWEIEFSGKSPKLPEGTIVEFAVLFRSTLLRTFELTVDASRQFREKKPFEDLVGFAPEIFLRAKIDFYRQPRTVQETMEKDPETFDVSRAPWTISFYDQNFSLGTPAQIEAQGRTVREFFVQSLRRALAAEKQLSTAREAAESGTRFRKEGVFDATAWQAFLEKEVRDPLRALQGELRVEKGGLRVISHPRALRDHGYLTEVVNAVARRSYERSRSLYEKLGMAHDPADLSPREIQIDCSKSTSAHLQELTEKICKSQEIPISELSTP